MAFWRQAITSLGLIGLLASDAYAQGNEKKVTTQGAASSVSDSISIEQMMASSRKATWKVAAEPYTEPTLEDAPGFLKPKKRRPQANTPPQWSIEGTKGGAMGDAFYSIPRDFHLDLGGQYGTIKGHGFSWKAGEKEFYYRGYPVLENIKSLEGERYDEAITLCDKTLAEFLDTYETERPTIEQALDENISTLQTQLSDIYLGKYEQKFVFDLFIHLLGILPEYGSDDGELTSDEYIPLGKELEEFASDFYDDDVSEEDKQRTQDAINGFARDMFNSYKDTDTYHTIRTVGQDPENNIKVGSMTLGDLERLAEGFGEILDVEQTREGIRGSRTLRGRGVAHAELSMTSEVSTGEQSGEFNHSVLSDNRADALAHTDIDLRFKRGTPVYVYVTDERIKLSLEQFGKLAGFDFHLLDVELKASMDYLYHAQSRFAESFELSEPTRRGWQGVGMVYDKGRSVFERADITISGEVNTAEKSISGRFHEEWLKKYKKHELTSLYVFNQETHHRGWYFVSAGVQMGDEKEVWRWRETEASMRLVLGQEEEITNTQHRDGHKDERFIFRPRVNVAGGFRHGLMSPFFAYTQLPLETLRFGILLDIPHVPSRVYVRATHDDFTPKNPMSDNTDISAEASVVLLDAEGNRKVMDYYIQEELSQASPRVSKQMDNQMLKSALYSDLEGMIMTARAIDKDLSLQGVWGTGSPFFIGMGYFGNVGENFHGGNLIIGYDEFAFDAGLAALSKDENHGHALRASVSGRICDTIIHLGVDGMLPAQMDDNGENYGSLQPGLDATLNISGYFHEEVLLRVFSPGWWKKKMSD